MHLVVGLGNPGLLYKPTRHNLGFMVVEKLARQNKISIKGRKYRSRLGTGCIIGRDVILLLPRTYMNLSGAAVQEVVGAEKISLNEILVVCDDVNLDLGKLRIRPKGSAGGHNGLTSIIKELKTENFARLRIGIAAPAKGGDLVKYVLSPFKRGERPVVRGVIERAVDAILSWLENGTEPTMAHFNN